MAPKDQQKANCVEKLIANNIENVHPTIRNQNGNRHRKHDNDANNGKNNANKSRQPLQAVVANPTAIRVQPSRQAKSKKQTAPMFDVYTDEPPKQGALELAATKKPGSSDQTSPMCPPVLGQMEFESACRSDGPSSPTALDGHATNEGVAEELYADDIYGNLLSRELRSLPKPGYMAKQADINHTMRKILVNWMVEVCDELDLSTETLFIAVSLTDRFLSKMSVLRTKLQLVGAAALFLAAKYEEIYPPGLKEFIYLTDDCYTADQLLRMEVLLLRVLDYDVAPPSPGTFLSRINKWGSSDEMTVALSQYLVELAMTEGEFYISFTPSLTSASAVCVAKHILGYPHWNDEMVKLSGYSELDLQRCVRGLCDLMAASVSSDQQAVRDKYCNLKYHQVSYLNPPAHYPV